MRQSGHPARGDPVFGLSAMVSMGNMLDLGFSDVLRHLADDRRAETVLLYTETGRRPPGFLAAQNRITAQKPVVVPKAGQHESGRKAAHSNTAAQMGSQAVLGAAIEQTGPQRVNSLGDLHAAAQVFAGRQRSHGPRLALITQGGGAGILAVAIAVDRDLRTAIAPLPTDR
nr:hypothetical protein [Salipiger mangrovisoli]